jgi:hypothetical protein
VKTITAAEFLAGRAKPKRRPYISRSKRSERTADGIVFDSQVEMRRYLELKGYVAKGMIRGFLRQPLFDLAGVVYRADFLVWDLVPMAHNPSRGAFRDVRDVHAEEVKGEKTHPEVMRRFRRNAQQVRELYGIEVLLVESNG